MGILWTEKRHGAKNVNVKKKIQKKINNKVISN